MRQYENNLLTEKFNVSIEAVDGQDIREERRTISKRLQKSPKGKMPESSIHSFYRAKIVMRDCSVEVEDTEWFISNYFQGSEVMSTEMKRLVTDKDLGYQPYVGVAYPAVHASFNPHVFCFLPLPLEKEGQSLTRLPVHVNGSFALDSNRRHMNWPTNDRTEDKDVSLEWNRRMITEVLPWAYTWLVTSIARYKDISPTLIYNALPNSDIVDEKWKILIRPVLNTLLNEPIFQRESGIQTSKYIRFQDAVFSLIPTAYDVSDSNKELLFTFVQKLCQSFVSIPKEVSETMTKIISSEHTPCAPNLVTPKFLSELMHDDKEEIYKEFSKETKFTLLKFLAADGNFQKFDSLELLPVDSKEHPFRTFHLENPDVTYIATEEQSAILRGLEDVLMTISYLDESNIKDVMEELSSKGKYKSCLILIPFWTNVTFHLIMQWA